MNKPLKKNDSQNMNSVPPRILLTDILDIRDRSRTILEQIRNSSNEPLGQKTLKRRFNRLEASKLICRSADELLAAEKAGKIPEPELDDRGRKSYTLESINKARQHFGTFPWRDPADEPLVLAVQNFKGGVGKTTLSTHFAHYLALQGYRVCFIDCDSQASATEIFGLDPDQNLSVEETLAPLFKEEEQDLRYAVFKTYWENLHIVPANLSLYSAEYAIAASYKDDPMALDLLREGISTIKDNYDVIIIDPPPALGMISLSVLRAADALIVPITPTVVDFSSTTHFVDMLIESLELLEKHGFPAEYKFFKIIASKTNDAKLAHTQISKVMGHVYAEHMLTTQMKDSAEIDNATARLMTVFEADGPLTASRETYNRCLAHLTGVCADIELLIRNTWMRSPALPPRLQKQAKSRRSGK